MPTKRITDAPLAASLDGSELLEVSQSSSAVRITATTISALASDNSFNDSGNGFIAAGFAVGNRVRVTGFTGNAANNIFAAVITALTAGKMTIGGADGDVIVDDAAGESVTIAKWETRAASADQIAQRVPFIGFSTDISPAQIVADANDYAPSGHAAASVLRLSSDASRNITGLAGGTDGRVLVLANIGTADIVLKDESASSTAANRFALSGDITLPGDSAIALLYDATSSRWRSIGAASGGSSGGGGSSPTSTANLLGIRVITATGAGVYTPTAGTQAVIVELLGAGGGGGGAGNSSNSSLCVLGEGGGGGAWGLKRLTADFSGAAYSVGAKGTGGAAGNNAGSAGGNTTFTTTAPSSTTYTAGGGSGGGFLGPAAPPLPGGQTAGGTTTGSFDISEPGGGAKTGNISSTTRGVASGGGPSRYSNGTYSAFNDGGNMSTAGAPGTGKGGGGGGAFTAQSGAAKAGGDGTDGMIIIWEYASPSGVATQWDFSPPLAASLSLASGDATNLTLTDDADVGLMIDGGAPVAGDVSRIAYRTLTTPSGDWKMVANILPWIESLQHSNVALFVRDSAGGRIASLTMNHPGNFNVYYWTGLTGYTSAPGSWQTNWPVHWLQIEKVGANLNFKVSADGKNWETLMTRSATEHLAAVPNQVGIQVLYARGSGSRVRATLPYFALSGSAV